MDSPSFEERVDAIVAAIEPPVTRGALLELAHKARAAEMRCEGEDRAEWARIAEALTQRAERFPG